MGIKVTILWFILLIFIARKTLSMCPTQCNCRWKKGKEWVECKKKNFRSLPPNIEMGTQVLDVSGNDIRNLRKNMFKMLGLINLQKLFLSQCNISVINQLAFSHLENLIELDLSRNELERVPRNSFRNISQLRELSLSENPLKYIHAKDFSHATTLIRLNVAYCLIKRIDLRAFQPLRFLQHLNLQGNHLFVFASMLIDSLRSLHGIRLHDNPWSCNCHLINLKIWLGTVGHLESPACNYPKRLKGRLFSSLQLRDFACPPRTRPTTQSVRADAGSNASFWCPVEGTPPPVISWFVGAKLLENGTYLNKKVHISIFNVNERENGSLLVLDGVTIDNARMKLKCIVSNPAGSEKTEFALNVSPTGEVMMGLNLSQLLIIFMVIVFLFCISCFILLKRMQVFASTSAERCEYPDYVNSGLKSKTSWILEPECHRIEDIIESYTQITDTNHLLNENYLAEDDIGAYESAINSHQEQCNTCFQEENPVIWHPEDAIAVLDFAAPECLITDEFSDEGDLSRKPRSKSADVPYRWSMLPENDPYFVDSNMFGSVVHTRNGAIPSSKTVYSFTDVSRYSGADYCVDVPFLTKDTCCRKSVAMQLPTDLVPTLQLETKAHSYHSLVGDSY